MKEIYVNKKDEIVMKLVHYFITEENYSPIIVNGTSNEVWLENSQGPYNIIRINSNYIHNQEQLNFDIHKTKNVIKQIKTKTLSINVNILTIFLDIRNEVSLKENEKNVDLVKVKNSKDISKNKKLNEIFPMLKTKLIKDVDNNELIFSVTKEINEKTTKENKKYEDVFSPKKIVITYILMGISILAFILTYIFNYEQVMTNFAIHPELITKYNEWYRLVTGTFLHVNMLHLVVNMYSLNIIGSQMEQFLGKYKYLAIYLISGIFGSLFSILITRTWSVGASGAIFGLLGSLLYFGYHYRLYLGNVLKTQILPIIFLNIMIGFMVPSIDQAAHMGGLVAGLLSTMALGVPNKSTKQERVNGYITLTILLLFLLYLLLK